MIMIKHRSKAKDSFKTSLFRTSEEGTTVRRKKAMVIPAANIDETENEYILTIASPGFKRKDVQVMIEKDIITIAATKENPSESCTHDRCEYDYTRWKRAFSLPDDADALHASARYKDGELTIRIPRGNTDKLYGITTIYVY
ncbi:MAG TPA: Hsp20/alpha crystallin family protein [Chitinophagaceae bacterium]